MHALLTRRRAAALGAAALVAGSLHFAVGASADTTTTTTSYSSSCFAQLVSLKLAGQDVLGQLDPGSDCTANTDAFFPTDTITGPANFPFVVNVLYENTSKKPDQSSARARTGVAHVFLPFSAFGGPDVTLDVLTSESSCNNGVATGSSHVVGLQVGDDKTGNKVELPGDITGDTIDQLEPLIRIELNKSADSGSSTTTGTNPVVRTDTQNHEQTALHVVVLTEDPTGQGIPAPLVDLTIAHTSVSCSKTTTTTTTGGGGGGGGDLPAQPGWMNGGGTMVDDAHTTVDPGTQVSHGFVLPCFKDQAPPPGGTNLTVNGDFGHFKLDAVDSVKCTDDPSNGDPENPKATFNTMDGTGHGVCNGALSDVKWHFTDEGEPNTADEAQLQITSRGDNGAACHLVVTGILTNGNNQAHPLPGSGSSSNKGSSKH